MPPAKNYINNKALRTALLQTQPNLTVSTMNRTNLNWWLSHKQNPVVPKQLSVKAREYWKEVSDKKTAPPIPPPLMKKTPPPLPPLPPVPEPKPVLFVPIQSFNEGLAEYPLSESFREWYADEFADDEDDMPQTPREEEEEDCGKQLALRTDPLPVDMRMSVFQYLMEGVKNHR